MAAVRKRPTDQAGQRQSGEEAGEARSAKRRRLLGLGVLSLGVLCWNNLVGLLAQDVHDVIYVPTNLAFLGLAAALVVPRARLDREQAGLARGRLRGSAAVGLLVGLLVPVPVFLMLALPEAAEEAPTNPRLEEIGAGEFAYQVAVRIPLGTALFEEGLFRGVLYGTFLRAGGHGAAMLWSSGLFGLWHVRPTYELLRENERFADGAPLVGGIVGGVAATFVGGLLFAWMRRKTGHVAGCVTAHALINSLSAVAVYLRG